MENAKQSKKQPPEAKQKNKKVKPKNTANPLDSVGTGQKCLNPKFPNGAACSAPVVASARPNIAPPPRGHSWPPGVRLSNPACRGNGSWTRAA